MARRFAPLSPWQVEVLQWIGDGCPERRWPDHTYKRTTYALAERHLVTVTKRRGSWQAAITDGGRFYLDHGRYQAADSMERVQRQVGRLAPRADPPPLAISPEALLAELQAAKGTVTVPSPTKAVRAAYRSAISRAINEQVVPAGYCLRHAGRDGGDLVIRLAPERERATRTPLAPIPIPATLADAHPAVRLLGDCSRGRLDVSAAVQDRALRLIQAIADECVRRDYGFAVPAQPTATFEIAVGDDTFPLTLDEEHESREVPDPEQLAAAKYAWQRIPSVTGQLPTGRLVLRLHFGIYRTRSWADRQRWTLESRLPTMFQAIAALAGEQATVRERQAAALRQRQQAWDEAIEQARRAYVRQLNRDELLRQVAASAEAEAIRAYCMRLDQMADQCDDPAQAARIRSWVQWGRHEAEATDPLNHPDELIVREPAEIGPSDLGPFMRRGMSAWSRPS